MVPGNARTPPNAAPRAGCGPAYSAFSLLEAMVTVALVGIIASLALPSVLPLRDSARLVGSADLVATAIVRARFEAMAQKRCTRFRLPTPRSFDIEVLNSFDCDVDPASAPRAVAGPLWISLLGAPVTLEDGITVAVVESPASSPGPGGEAGELRFRPSGRVFGQDANLANDTALFRISSARGQHEVFAQGNGLVCRLKGAEVPVTGPAGKECP